MTRRDELVLKRLRTGEIRDPELLGAMALPGARWRSWWRWSPFRSPWPWASALPLNPVVYRVTVVAVRTVRGLRVLDSGLDPQRGGGADDQPPGDPARHVGQMDPVFPESGSAALVD